MLFSRPCRVPHMRLVRVVVRIPFVAQGALIPSRKRQRCHPEAVCPHVFTLFGLRRDLLFPKGSAFAAIIPTRSCWAVSS
jgi:hypothetical protein